MTTLTAPAQNQAEPTTDKPSARPERALAHRVLGIRSRATSGQGGRGTLAAIAAGIHPMTEALAFPHTEAALGGLTTAQRVGARRVAAMIAVHRNTASTGKTTSKASRDADGKTAYTPIGSTLRSLHVKAHDVWPGHLDARGNQKRTGMSMQVDSLPLLDVETASVVISELVGRCAKHNIAVDFPSLASTLAFWGDGMTSKSRAHRAKVVQDFYGLSD